jgi:hypothetical protein
MTEQPELVRAAQEYTPDDWVILAEMRLIQEPWATPTVRAHLAFWAWRVAQRGQHPDFW